MDYTLDSKDRTVESPLESLKKVADPEDLCMTRLGCNGASELEVFFGDVAPSLGVKIEVYPLIYPSKTQ